MTELQKARHERGWTQAELADRLGVTQAYVCLLERGHRPVPRRLAHRLARVLKLSPSLLPMERGTQALTAGEASSALGTLGYPGFAYLRHRRPLNPADVLLRALRAPDMDARVVEALPWLLVRYPDLDWSWLLREAKANDLQNRLGFLLGLAREIAARLGDDGTARKLGVQQDALEGSRLLREAAFRESITEAERRWLREHRPPQATHWNMLSTMNARELADAY